MLHYYCDHYCIIIVIIIIIMVIIIIIIMIILYDYHYHTILSLFIIFIIWTRLGTKCTKDDLQPLQNTDCTTDTSTYVQPGGCEEKQTERFEANQ